MNILITGAAGFIGFHLTKKLIDEGLKVVGVDNINDYYSRQLKFDRLKQLGIKKRDADIFNSISSSESCQNFQFIRLNLEDYEELNLLFEKFNFNKVVHLAAQAGVRYSIENPKVYINSNIVGFANLLECCKKFKTQHLIYASSSSVYGENKNVPFSTKDNVDNPISLYAATKKSNELMAYTYSHLFKFKTTGLRLFTVYGPWGRPDMAMFLFTDAILQGKEIKVFNKGNLKRDFTFIDDIVDGIFKILTDDNKRKDLYKLYNIGNSKPVNLLHFIETIEKELGKKAIKRMLPMQPGDVTSTWADIEDIKEDFQYSPQVTIAEGVKKFIDWYKMYYSSKELI